MHEPLDYMQDYIYLFIFIYCVYSKREILSRISCLRGMNLAKRVTTNVDLLILNSDRVRRMRFRDKREFARELMSIS